MVGGIAKMRSTTNKAKGTTMEDITKVQYETQNGHPVENCGLVWRIHG